MKDPFILVRHILDAIERIELYTNDVDKSSEFEKNFMISNAVMRNITIIGEASKKIPDDLKDGLPQIPWKKITGMRNRLIHEYFIVDLETVWNVVEIDLPELKLLLIQVLKSKQRDN